MEHQNLQGRCPRPNNFRKDIRKNKSKISPDPAKKNIRKFGREEKVRPRNESKIVMGLQTIFSVLCFVHLVLFCYVFTPYNTGEFLYVDSEVLKRKLETLTSPKVNKVIL